MNQPGFGLYGLLSWFLFFLYKVKVLSVGSLEQLALFKYRFLRT